jgi:hypothetical protein
LKSKKLGERYLNNVENVEKLVDTVSKLNQSAENLHAEIKDTEDDIHRTRKKYEALAEKQRKQNQKRIVG